MVSYQDYIINKKCFLLLLILFCVFCSDTLLAEQDYPRPTCNHKTKVLNLDGRGIDLDHDKFIDIQYISEGMFGEVGPFLATEGGSFCSGTNIIGSGNRLCNIDYVNQQLENQLFLNGFCEIDEAIGYVAGNDNTGTYFTYCSGTPGDVFILRSYNGLNYYKLQIAGYNGKTIKLYIDNINKPDYENCEDSGESGMQDYVDFLNCE